MVKITPSALITGIKGTLGGNTFQNWKGSIVLRRTPSPSSVITAKKALVEGINSTISGCYYSLSTDLKNSWGYFASLISSTISGSDAFQKVNVANLSREHPALCAYDTPLCTYNPPFTPVYTGGRYCLKYDRFEFYWGTPACLTVYVTGYYSAQVGYSNENWPTFRMGSTVLSNLGRICFDASEYQIGQIFRLRGDSITPYGVTSSKSALVSAEKVSTFSYPPLLFILDSEYSKCMKFMIPSNEYSQILPDWSGSPGYLNGPRGICSDEDYIYITDTYNHRICKFNKTDLSFVASFGSSGSGDSNFSYPKGISCDSNRLYICDSGNDRIKVHLKSDLSYLFAFGTSGSGSSNFDNPVGICYFNNILYITDSDNHRFKLHSAVNGSYISEYGSEGSGPIQFSYPHGISCNSQYIFIVDTGNDRISVWGLSVTVPFTQFGSSGSGDLNFDGPLFCCLNSSYLYITDAGNFRVVYYNLDTLSFSGKFGQEGEAPWQFAILSGICTMTTDP
jgi:DNA-binding beta-propeller fold protein YncE